MISNDYLQSNYLGRDGFTWWVGQIADPDKSGWGNAKESQNKRRFDPDIQDLPEHEVYERRCKVRIFGYHTISDKDGYVLKDSDLPWAHILVPSGMGSGIHGLGITHEYQGGENVLGFFLDGDDAQQPVIIGSFARGLQTGDVKNTPPSEKKDESDCIIKPFKPVLNTGEMRHQHLVKNQKLKNGPRGKDYEDANTGQKKTANQSDGQSTMDAIAGGNSDETGDKAAAKLVAPVNVTRPGVGKGDDDDDDSVSSLLGEMEGHLNSAIKTLKAVQKYKEVYFDSTVNTINSLANQIGGQVKAIAGLIRKVLEIVKGELVDLFNIAFTEAQVALPETFKPILGLTFNELIEVVLCVFDQFLELGVFDKIFDIISKNILGNILDALLCAVENILTEILNEFLQPIFDAIKGTLKALGTLFGTVGNFMGKAISKALTIFENILSFFKCAPSRFRGPESAGWELSGPSKIEKNNFANILGNIKIPEIPLPPGLDESKRESLKCDANIAYLFPPKVEFSFGNALGQAFVSDGKVIGIFLVEPGKGYSPLTPPAISIKQPGNYGTGGGAKAIAIVGPDGSIENVCLTSPGTGYVSTPEVAATSISSLEEEDFGLLPLPKTSDQVDAIPYLKDIYIKFPGSGYKDTDTVLINNEDPSKYGLKLEMDTGPTGFISEINIQNNNNTPPVFRNLPQISILSDTGSGAIAVGCLGFMIVETQKKDDSGNIVATTADGQTITVNASDIKTSVNCFLQ